MRHNELTVFSLAAVLSIAFAMPCYAGPDAGPDQKNNIPPSSGPAALKTHTAEKINNLPGLSNVGRVAPGIYRGALPDKTGYETLKKLGVRTVIDMRTTESESADVEAAGMKSIAVPIQMTRDGLQAKVEQVVALMSDPANQPVYFHCRHGKDRTGIVVAAYRMKHQGWSLAEAETEMQAFGFNNIWINFKKFIRDYGRQLEAQKTLAGGHFK